MKRRRSMMRAIKGMMFKLPGMITCRQFEDFIVAYLDGTLPEQHRKRFEFHLKVCRECQEYLAAYRAGLEAANQSVPEMSDMDDVPEDLIAAVMASRM